MLARIIEAYITFIIFLFVSFLSFASFITFTSLLSFISYTCFNNYTIKHGGYEEYDMTKLQPYALVPIEGHKIDYSRCAKIDKRVLEYFKYNAGMTKEKPLLLGDVSHTWPDAEYGTFVKVMQEDAKQGKYYLRDMEFKKYCHWGQLKLHLSEVEFLTLAMNKFKDSTRQIVFVYAGAAPGYHIPYLVHMFPNIIFELYDPNPFSLVESRYYEKTKNRIFAHVQFFTEDDAAKWHKESYHKHILFCSDIRIDNPDQDSIADDMKIQLKWHQIINPDLAMYKFRLPWNDKYTEYVKGDIYIQAFPKSESTETRLIVHKDAPMTQYNNRWYEQVLFYHNTFYRGMRYKHVLGTVTLKNDGICDCYDCTRFVNIMRDYLFLTSNDMTKLKPLIDETIANTMSQYQLFSKTVLQQNIHLNMLLKYCMQPCNKYNCRVCVPNYMTLEKYVKKYFTNRYKQSVATRENADKVGVYKMVDEEKK